MFWILNSQSNCVSLWYRSQDLKNTMSGSVRRPTKSVRPLGAVRQPIQSFERVGKIPAFNYNKTIHHDYELQGNAMQVGWLWLPKSDQLVIKKKWLKIFIPHINLPVQFLCLLCWSLYQVVDYIKPLPCWQSHHNGFIRTG